MIYFDSAYVAKFYLNELGQAAIRSCAISAGEVAICALALAEVNAVFHRKLREGFLTPGEAAILYTEFDRDVRQGLWNLLPLTTGLLEQVASAYRTLPATVFVRSADALHLICARENGFAEIHTNDRHVLTAAPHFGLKGVDVTSSTRP
jgi:predicted nucleic acid-binding protein